MTSCGPATIKASPLQRGLLLTPPPSAGVGVPGPRRLLLPLPSAPHWLGGLRQIRFCRGSAGRPGPGRVQRYGPGTRSNGGVLVHQGSGSRSKVTPGPLSEVVLQSQRESRRTGPGPEPGGAPAPGAATGAAQLVLVFRGGCLDLDRCADSSCLLQMWPCLLLTVAPSTRAWSTSTTAALRAPTPHLPR